MIRTYVHVQGKMNYLSKFHFLIPATMLILTMVLTSIIVNGYIKTKVLPKPSPTPISPSLTPSTPAPTPQVKVENKKYANPRLAISFDYPSNLKLLECPTGVIYLYEEVSSDENINCQSQDFYVVMIKNASTNFYPVNSEIQKKEELIKIGGSDAVKETLSYPNPDSPRQILFRQSLTFSNNNIYFLIQIKSESDQNVLNQILNSFKFIEDITVSWQTHSNNFFSFKYPPTWTLTPSATGEGITRLSQNPADQTIHNLILEYSSSVKDVNLTALEVISSTRNLPDWSSPPTIDIRNIGGGTAQILQGKYGSSWHIFAVIWYKNHLVQIIWDDDLEKSTTEVFENILSSFKFL